MTGSEEEKIMAQLRQMQGESLRGFARIEDIVGEMGTRISTLEFHYASIARDFAEVRVTLDRHDRRLRLMEGSVTSFDVI